MGQRSLTQYVLASVVLHAVIVGVLSLSMEFIPRSQPKPQVIPIQATAVDSKAVQRKIDELRKAQKKKTDDEKRRVRELERKLKAAEDKRKAEEHRIKKLQQERKRREAEKRKADEAAKQAKLKQKREQEKARKAEQARKRKEEERRKAEKVAAEAKKKREAEEAKRKREEAEKKRKAREQKELEDMMAAEMAAEAESMSQARRQHIISEQDKYEALIRATITRNWTVDASMEGKSCTLEISLARDGFVTSVNQGKGDTVVCQSARTAVLKAQTLPVSQDPEVYEQMKKISLNMRPSF